MAISTHRRNYLTGLPPSSTSTHNSVRVEHGNPSISIRMRVCFSFATYAKSLIDHLISSQTATFRFIRDSIDSARRSSSRRRFSELAIGVEAAVRASAQLPIVGICKSVRDDGFWMNGWGMKPRERDRAVDVAARRLREAPVLIPVYKTFYIPSEPNQAGNPIFEVIGCDVKVSGFDIAGFFERRVEFNDRRVTAPPWKATEARSIVTWTEMAEAERGGSGGWWWRCGGEGYFGKGLEDAFWRLRDGGWDEDEVMEVMRMDGQDCVTKSWRLEMDGHDSVDGDDGFEMDGEDGFEMEGETIKCEF